MSATLVLTRSDVARLLTLDACIDSVERALVAHARGRSVAPQVLSFNARGGGFHIKAAGLRGGRGVFAAKINGNFGGNPRRGRPRIQGVVALFDLRDGRPLALLDSTSITALRTAAMTAVAARRLARKDARTATICGCGLQGRIQLRALLRVLPLEQVRCWDRSAAAGARFAREMSREREAHLGALPDAAAHAGALSSRPWFADGLLTNLLNPKVAAFYLGFLPQFVPAGGNGLGYCLMLAGIHIAMGFLWLVLYASAVERLSAALGALRLRRRLQALAGMALLGLGLKLALSERGR